MLVKGFLFHQQACPRHVPRCSGARAPGEIAPQESLASSSRTARLALEKNANLATIPSTFNTEASLHVRNEQRDSDGYSTAQNPSARYRRLWPTRTCQLAKGCVPPPPFRIPAPASGVTSPEEPPLKSRFTHFYLSLAYAQRSRRLHAETSRRASSAWHSTRECDA